ncbi:hypothetical protein G6L37_35025 [Agrobacterium rubi]|nr:hypothetical protein [Agrobacterium rubi]NTF23783.1 hypothetical protein [Agrobacterium rubi]
MSYFITISIFGKVSDPEVIHELAETVRDEEGLDDPCDESDVIAKLREAASNGTAVEFNGYGYDDMFHDVAFVCRKAGLSYVWTIGERGGEGPTNGKAWKPGLRSDVKFMMHDNQPGIALGTIAAVAKRGIEAVDELVSTLASATKVGKIEIEPGFNEAYRALLDEMTEEPEDDLEEDGMKP